MANRKVRPGKALNWSTLQKRKLAKITQANIDLMAQRWQVRQPVVTQEEADTLPGLIVTGRQIGRRVIYEPPRPDALTNIVSTPEVE